MKQNPPIEGNLDSAPLSHRRIADHESIIPQVCTVVKGARRGKAKGSLTFVFNDLAQIPKMEGDIQESGVAFRVS